MSWAEVKKINSNLDTPLNDYLNGNMLGIRSIISKTDSHNQYKAHIEISQKILLHRLLFDARSFGSGTVGGSARGAKINFKIGDYHIFNNCKIEPTTTNNTTFATIDFNSVLGTVYSSNNNQLSLFGDDGNFTSIKSVMNISSSTYNGETYNGETFHKSLDHDTISMKPVICDSLLADIELYNISGGVSDTGSSIRVVYSLLE